jgi:hypothetical protein
MLRIRIQIYSKGATLMATAFRPLQRRPAKYRSATLVAERGIEYRDLKKPCPILLKTLADCFLAGHLGEDMPGVTYTLREWPGESHLAECAYKQGALSISDQPLDVCQAS